VLLNASLIGAGALTLSTSYAFGDIFGTKSSLHRSFSDAKGFYAMYSLVVAGAAAIVLIPGAPLGIITEAVQALAGVLLPSASMFLLLLCNDPAVLGPWVNRAWLNALAVVIEAVLLLLSLILMASTVFPNLNVTTFGLIGAAAMLAGLLVFGAVVLRSRRVAPGIAVAALAPDIPKEQWTMPPIALLERPRQSVGRRAAMLAMEGYLGLAIVILVVKAVQLAGG
jgi:Natural resistance-associated macrophage protein